MKTTKAAGRYAQSLLDLSLEQKALEDVRSDMELVSATCSENRELELLLHSPIVKPETKRRALKSIFEKSVSKLSLSFIDIVTAKGREPMLHAMAEAFLALYKKHKGIVQAEVVSAAALSADQRKGLIASLSGLGNTIELEETIDPSLLGGLKIKVGDQRIDASLLRKLNELKVELLK